MIAEDKEIILLKVSGQARVTAGLTLYWLTMPLF
jgi:hypothetical protein